MLHIKHGQKQAGLHIIGPFLHDPLQLQHRQVVAPVLGVDQGLVKLLDGLAGDLQLPRLSLDFVQVMIRPVFLRL